MKISDISVSDGALFYVMPLPDGIGGLRPLDENRRSDTLQARIDARRRGDKWFSRAEVMDIFAKACAAGRPVLALNKDYALELAEYFETLGDKEAMNALKNVVWKYIDQSAEKHKLEGLWKVRDRFAAVGNNTPASVEKEIGELGEKSTTF